MIHADTPHELKEWIQIIETNIHWLNENQELIDPRLSIKQVTLSAEKEGILGNKFISNQKKDFCSC